MRLTRIEKEDARRAAKRFLKLANLPSGSKWLITGGSGFIGTQILNTLNALREVGNEIEVTVLENGLRGGVRDWYFQGINVIDADVTNDWPQLDRFDYVIHLASIASPVFYREFPLETLDANIKGTRIALDMARMWNSKVLIMSSSEIYGDPAPTEIPTKELYRGHVDCLGPRACYDESKRTAETLAWIYQNKFNTRVNIARPFNFYGPGMRLDDGRVLPDIFSSIVSNKDIELFSDGTPTRSFCYISDAVTALLVLATKAETNTVFNVGVDDTEVSMYEVAEVAANIARKQGWNGEIKLANSKEKDFLVNNPSRRCPDTSKIRTYFNWIPEISLSEGLERSIEHFLEIKEFG